MTHINALVEQHILEHESRSKHIDGLVKAGPMSVWDVVAQRLENVVERIERKTGPV